MQFTQLPSLGTLGTDVAVAQTSRPRSHWTAEHEADAADGPVSLALTKSPAGGTSGPLGAQGPPTCPKVDRPPRRAVFATLSPLGVSWKLAATSAIMTLARPR